MRFPLNVKYDLLQAVLEASIPIGQPNAIARKDLAEALGVNPAACKNMLWLAVQSGLPVKQNEQGAYYLEPADDEREYSAFRYTRRAEDEQRGIREALNT